MKTVFLSIIYYNSEAHFENLMSCFQNSSRRGIRLRITVVNNASPDLVNGSKPKELKNKYPEVDWIDLSENLGFARGHNLSIKKVLEEPTPPDVIGILNPDVIFGPDAIQLIVERLFSAYSDSVVSPLIEDSNGSLDWTARRFPSILSELIDASRVGLLAKLFKANHVAKPPQDSDQKCDWVPFAFCFMTPNTFLKAGGLNEKYFMYFEDIDFFKSLPSKKAAVVLFDVKVCHFKGGSSGVTSYSRTPKILPQYWYESRRLYFLRHHSEIYANACDLARQFGYLLRKFKSLFFRNIEPAPVGYWLAMKKARNSVKLEEV
jgi:GT2 family glycosyltransferase